ncbi:MAG TPA: DUF4956 domain-containing protein [Anaeromyxobacter sp.]|nr:DUF4956 domain-containing protein [Anaeromyxobacter sp.]
MNPFTHGSELLHAFRLEAFAPRFAAAVAIGALIAARPWRVLMGRRPPRPEMVQAQILLCVAAALVIVVIGDSVAKAFGLVGLGSFVRFRSGLKDPRDAAVLFLVIGLGMACGHGALGVAFAGASLAALLLAVMDLFNVPDLPPKPDGDAVPSAPPQATSSKEIV